VNPFPAVILVAAVASPAWTTAAPGLEVGRFPAPRRSDVGDSIVTVVRVDPARYGFSLLSAKLLGLSRTPTAPEWAAERRVTGVINASMFQTDHRTSVSYMRDGERVNQRRWSRDKAVFVSGPLRPGLPPVQILDRSCQAADGLAAGYRVVAQNIRMLDCEGRNVWAQQPRKWSTACVGTDRSGRVLFVHVRSPYSTHDLIDILKALPLDLKRLMYVEGGPEASLYVALDGRPVVSEVGSFETGFFASDGNRTFWPLPNVLAFAPLAAGTTPP
jgi:hypothetical protein